jgi:hypothetical protein
MNTASKNLVAGFSPDEGLVGVMLHEHKEGNRPAGTHGSDYVNRIDTLAALYKV